MEAGALSYWLPVKPPWLDAALRVRVAMRVACALQAMHALNWVHRDVKSANVLLNCSGEAVLGDTGLAKQADVGGCSRGGGIGTLGYVCPDYKRTGVLKTVADVYGLGVLLVELLTGCVAQATREQEARNVRSFRPWRACKHLTRQRMRIGHAGNALLRCRQAALTRRLGGCQPGLGARWF
jgi:serine/threonine protein kinase